MCLEENPGLKQGGLISLKMAMREAQDKLGMKQRRIQLKASKLSSSLLSVKQQLSSVEETHRHKRQYVKELVDYMETEILSAIDHHAGRKKETLVNKLDSLK